MVYNVYMRGVTLIELIIVIAVFSIIAMFIAPSGVAWRASRELERATATVLDIFAEARERTLQSKNALQYGVAIDDSDIVLFEGTAYTDGASSNEYHDLGENITAVDMIEGGATSVYFSRLMGEASATGTIEISHSITGASRRITIYATGLVDEQ